MLQTYSARPRRARALHACLLLATLAAFPTLVRATTDLPHVYAITGARIVPVAAAEIPVGTVVIRGGLIEAVGAEVVVPAGAVPIDARGMVVYPGLIDLASTTGVELPSIPSPSASESRQEIERWKRRVLLRADVDAASHVRVDAPGLQRLAATGVTTVLAVPPGEAVHGRSALMNVVPPPSPAQIGQLADPVGGRVMIRTPVALHVSFPARPRGNAYPQSLLGVIAFVRQSFLDAQQYGAAQQQYRRQPKGRVRPAHDAALEALQPALDGSLPVAFEAGSAREIHRALALARELSLVPIITGAQEAPEDVTTELRAAGAAVIVSLNYPTRPASLAPDADEPLRVVRFRAEVPGVPARLHEAGVRFGFGSAGLRERRHFLRHVSTAIQAGLPPEAAVRALTIDAAAIAGAADRVGSITPGKIANLIVASGDLFHEKTTIQRIFIDGAPVRIADEATPASARQR